MKGATTPVTGFLEKFIVQITNWKWLLSVSARNMDTASLETTVIKPTTKRNVKLNSALDMNVLKGTQGNVFSTKTLAAASLDPFVLIIIKLKMKRN